jgi:hypothetical protein
MFKVFSLAGLYYRRTPTLNFKHLNSEPATSTEFFQSIPNIRQVTFPKKIEMDQQGV